MLLNFQLNHYPTNPNVDPRFYLVSHCFVKFHNVLTFIDYTNVATCIKQIKSRAPVSYVLICLSPIDITVQILLCFPKGDENIFWSFDHFAFLEMVRHS